MSLNVKQTRNDDSMLNPLLKFRSNTYRLVVYPLALVAVAVLVFLGWIKEPAPELGARLSSADMLARSGALAEAEEQLKFIFDEEPDNRHGWLIQGLVDERRGDHLQAIESYRRALAGTKEEDLARDIRLSIADLYRRAEDFDGASRELDDLEADVGRHATISRIRGLIAWSQKDYRASRALFRQAKALSDDKVEYDAMAAGTFIAEARLSEARDILAALPEEAAAAWPYWRSLARSYLEAGDGEGARDALAHYIRLDASGKNRIRRDDFWMQHAAEVQLDELLQDG